jgi:hypothetical protein
MDATRSSMAPALKEAYGRRVARQANYKAVVTAPTKPSLRDSYRRARRTR